MKLFTLIAISFSFSLFAGGSGGIKSIVGPAIKFDEKNQVIIIDLSRVETINTLGVGIIEARDVKENIDRIESAKISANQLIISMKSNDLLDVIQKPH